MYERHIHTIREAFFPKHPEKPERVTKSRVEIVRRDKRKLVAVLVEKSIFIPLESSKTADEKLNQIFEENLQVLNTIPATGIAESVGKFLNMNLHSGTDGIYLDGDFVGTTAGLHLHPGGQVNSQKEFLNQLKYVLSQRGLKVSVKKSL